MDQRTRILVAAALVVFLCAALAVQAAAIDREVRGGAIDDEALYGGENDSTPVPAEAELDPDERGNTLISVHSYRNNGALVEVDADGEVVWEWRPPDSRVWAAEHLDPDTVLVAVAYYVDAEDCPEEHITHETYTDHQDHCVENVIKELDKDTKEANWDYRWYDDFIHWHEVHDIEYMGDGEIAVSDMGNDRAFVVNREGEITWEWLAKEHLNETNSDGETTPFWEEYVEDNPHLGEGDKNRLRYNDPRDDWTHKNDIAYLENGNFQMSIRNFDVIIEVDPETDEIVDVIGEPGNHSILERQHNPHRLDAHDTMLVADSEGNRIIEIDLATEHREIIWEYHGPPGEDLQWPRDASRLPNGNTLVTDSRNNRVLEIDPDGDVVWMFEDPGGEVIPNPYEADRVLVDEQPDAPPGDNLTAIEHDRNPVQETVREGETLAQWVLPSWMHLPQLLNLLGIVFGSLWLLGELALIGWRGVRSR